MSFNPGFDPDTIEKYRQSMKTDARNFIAIEEDNNTDEYFRFYFIGQYEGKPVIFDTVLTTLRFEYESELFEIAEERASVKFPEYDLIKREVSMKGTVEALNEKEEEIGVYIAEVILELQEEDEVKVQEHLDIDTSADFGINIHVGLFAEKITSQVVEKFIQDFNQDKLELDDTFFSFQTEDDEEEG